MSTTTRNACPPSSLRLAGLLLALVVLLGATADAAAARRRAPRPGEDAQATSSRADRRTGSETRASQLRRARALSSRSEQVTRSPGPADYARAGRTVKPAAPRPRLTPALRELLQADAAKASGGAAVHDVRLVALPGRVESLVARVGARRGTVRSVHGPVVRASLSLEAIESVLSAGTVRAASLDARRRRPDPRKRLSSLAKTGNVVTEGLSISGADEWQTANTATFGLERESPVRVAIVDFGFDGYADLVGTELPPSVTTADFAPGWDIEGCVGGLPPCIPDGTAMAEIVADMAPSVSLVLIAIDPSDLASVDQASGFLRTGGAGSTPVADIVVSGLGWQPGIFGDGFGTGPIASAIAEVTAAGMPWINDVGDRDFLSLLLYDFVPAQADHWHGSFADDVDHFFGGAFDNDGYMDAWFSADDPAAGETWLNGFCLGSMDVLLIDLVWDDWDDADGNGDPSPTQDYSVDVYEDLGAGQIALFDSSANFFGNDQTGVEGQFPRDALDVVNTGPDPVCFFLALFAESATDANRFHVYWAADSDVTPGSVSGDFLPPDSLTEGDRVIPADSADVYAIAATGIDDLLESFTTSGLPGETTPRLCAPDDVETVALSGSFLTSFGAAHVAGAMALLMQKVNFLDTDRAIEVLEGRARTVLPAADPRCGAGRLCTLLGGCPLAN